MRDNFPGDNFLGGNFPGGIFPGGGFSGGGAIFRWAIFPGAFFLELYYQFADCIRVGSISDVSKNCFLNEFTSLKKEYFMDSNSFIIRFLKFLKSSFKLSLPVVCILFIWSPLGIDRQVLFGFIFRFLILLEVFLSFYWKIPYQYHFLQILTQVVSFKSMFKFNK